MIKTYGKYQIIEKLGSGSFGDVYLGQDSSGNKVAIKLEPLNAKVPQLLNESKVYNYLQKNQFISKMYYFGSDSKYNILVTDVLGPSIEDIFNAHNRKFNISTILIMAIKFIEIIKSFHEYNFIHRDIKPENFLVNTGPIINKIYIIDFGLSKRYKNDKTLEHIKYNTGKSLIGTPRYASLNNHRGFELSRRDDLESIGYMIIYLIKGSLPWQGLKSGKSDNYTKIHNKKLTINISELCDCPIKNELITYIEYIRNLKFEDTPNYTYLKGIFYNAIKRFNEPSIFTYGDHST